METAALALLDLSTTRSSPAATSTRPKAFNGLPLEILRKIATEVATRSHLQSFALVCRSTSLPARELLFDTLTLASPGSTLFQAESIYESRPRQFPFPDLARNVILARDENLYKLSAIDLVFLLNEAPNARKLTIHGHFAVTLCQYDLESRFANIVTLSIKTSNKDYNQELLRALLSLCRNIATLDLDTDLDTFVDPITHWHFAPRPAYPIPSYLTLPKLRRLILRSPLYLSLTSINAIASESLQQVRSLELDFSEENVRKTWDLGDIFPIDFLDSFSTSLEHFYFNFPLYSKRSNVDTLSHLLSNIPSLRSLTLGSVSSGAAWLLVGLPSSCTEIHVQEEGGSPDWMGFHRFFAECEGNPLLADLKGRRIWMKKADCQFCDEHFQTETEERCKRLGVELIVPNEGRMRVRKSCVAKSR